MFRFLIIFILLLTKSFASEKEKIYKVAFLKDWKPYYIIHKNNKLDGYAFELFEAISKQTDLKFEYVVANGWVEAMELSKNGEIDIVPNVGITKDRELIFNFTQATDTFKIKLFKRKESIYLKTKNDLKDRTLGIMKGNICDKIITKDLVNNKIVFSNFSRFINALSSGEIDAICYPEPLLNTKLKELELSNKIETFEKSLLEVKRGVGITKDNFELLPITDEAISEIKVNGEFEKIYAKWFGKKEKSFITKETFQIFLLIVTLIVLALTFVLYWNNRLKKEYKKQKELKERLKSAQEIAKLGHYTYFHKTGNFTCSEQINKIFGIDNNIKKDTNLWLSLIHPEDKNRVKEYWNYTLSNEVDFELEYRVINQKTKEIIWVHGLGKIIRDKNNNPIQMFGTIQNINERKKIEEKLTQAMMVFENTHDGILITDKDTNIINVNKSFEITTGYSLEEVYNKKPSILKSEENNNPDIYKQMWESLNKKGVWTGEIVNKAKSNKNYTELLTINTIYNQNREITGYIGIFTDITQNKNNEKMLINQSKVAALGEMLGNISHQWRQPLSIISTHVTGLKLNLELGVNVEKDNIMKSMSDINTQVQYLSKTIDDFRSFFKSDKHEAFSFFTKECFEKLESLIKDTLNNNYIKYDFNIVNIKLIGNENLFIQALINICNNAKDALVDNIKNSDDRFLFIETKENGKNFEIFIKDTGGGIPLDIKDKIFDPYFTTKHQSVGTGIGLYMSHQIITKQLHGQIFVDNVTIEINQKELKGAQIKIVLPLG